MNEVSGKAVLDMALRILPREEWVSVAYVGVCPKTFGEWKGWWFLDRLYDERYKMECLFVEVNPEYVKKVRESEAARRYERLEFVCADVRDWAKAQKDHWYDVIVWWHGPEHVPRRDFEALLKEFDRICRLLIVGLPLGNDPYQDPDSPDRHEATYSLLDLTSMGFWCTTQDRSSVGQGPGVSGIRLCGRGRWE